MSSGESPNGQTSPTTEAATSSDIATVMGLECPNTIATNARTGIVAISDTPCRTGSDRVRPSVDNPGTRQPSLVSVGIGTVVEIRNGRVVDGADHESRIIGERVIAVN